jgi:hypothetical protein
MTRRDDIHTHDIAFDRSDFDPVEHRVSRFLGNYWCSSAGSADPTSKPLTGSFGYLQANGSAAGAIFSSS